jgi:Tfp pilus assembly protein FimV
LVALLMAVALVAVTMVTGQAVLSTFGAVEPSSPRPVDVPDLSPTVGETYIVQPGDTLWSIAAAIAPDSDPRPVVNALRAANGGPDLQVGQRLTLVTE